MNTVTPTSPGPGGSLRKIEKYNQAIVPNPVSHKPSNIPFTIHIKSPRFSKTRWEEKTTSSHPFPAPSFLSETADRCQHTDFVIRNRARCGVDRSKPDEENIVGDPARAGRITRIHLAVIPQHVTVLFPSL